MVIMEAHIIMQNTLIALELNIFQKIEKRTGNENIITDIYRIQAH